VLILVAVLAAAAVLGRLNGPDKSITDPRRSTLLTGPAGARALGDALQLLGVNVERRRRSLLDIDAASDGEPGRSVVALLDVPYRPDRAEVVAVKRFLDRGGRLFVAGQSGLDGCFGYHVSNFWLLRTRSSA